MANFSYTVGSKTTGTYFERFEGTRVLSPRSDLLVPPYAYTRDNNYDWFRESYQGPMVTWSKYADMRPPHYTNSSWTCNTVSNIGASYPSTVSTLSKLVDKWKNSDVNIGVSLGEGKESLSMIASSLVGIAQSARSIKRGDLGGAIRHLQHPVPRRARRKAAKRLSQGDVSGSWLALNLGWAPMISDIYAMSEYLKDQGGYAKVSSGWDKGVATALTAGKFTKRECKQRYVCKVRTPPSEYDRLGLTNPAVIAWELVPLSFVADYFLPIGDFVNALTALRIDAPSFLLEKRLEVRVTHPGPVKGKQFGSCPGNIAIATQPGQIYSFRMYSRTKTTVVQQLVAASISVDVPSSLKRLSNLAALAHQSILNLRK